jgi:recombination protein RecA
VLQAQREGEPAAWITTGSSTFFPPDVAHNGVDLDALPVIRVVDARGAARAADKLLRSGAFGLVILDLGAEPPLPMPMQSRLLGLVGKHETALLFLTEKQSEAASVGSMVSLRAQVTRKKSAEGRFTCDVRIIKDKRRGPGWSHQEIRHGPAGLH